MLTSFVVIGLALLFSAFFSGMEIAYITANPLRIELDKQKHQLFASNISFLQQRPREYIATMLVGNNFALVIYGLFMGELLTPYLRPMLQSEISLTLVQTLISTIIILFTAEYLPKSLFRVQANRALTLFALPVRMLYVVFYPITWITVSISDKLLSGILRVKISQVTEQRVFGKADVDVLLTNSHPENGPAEHRPTELRIFQNVLEFSDILVRECMVPRNEMEAIEVSSPVRELEKLFADTGYSRIPVYDESVDNVIGYVHHLQMYQRPRNIRSLVKEITIVPASMSIKTLLTKFMAEQRSIAVVVDEFGGTAGIITTEDILEEIFGEIEDEHDQSEFHEEVLAEGEFIFSGRLEIDYLNEKYKLGLDDSDEYETLAGFVLHHHQSIPAENDWVLIGDYRLQALKLDGPRIELIKLIIEK